MNCLHKDWQVDALPKNALYHRSTGSTKCEKPLPEAGVGDYGPAETPKGVQQQ